MLQVMHGVNVSMVQGRVSYMRRGTKTSSLHGTQKTLSTTRKKKAEEEEERQQARRYR